MTKPTSSEKNLQDSRKNNLNLLLDFRILVNQPVHYYISTAHCKCKTVQMQHQRKKAQSLPLPNYVRSFNESKCRRQEICINQILKQAIERCMPIRESS